MMAISLISYFASRRRKSPRRRRLRSPPAASEDSSEKSLFFVTINDKLERYCYKSNPWPIEKTGRKRKRGCTCSNYQQRPEQHQCNRRRITALEPIRDGTFGFRVNVRSTYVSLGSTIYCIGGYLNAQSWTRQDTVLCFDTTCPGWKLCPSTIRCRVQPLAVAIDGKLYVFGGIPPRGSYNFNDYKDHEDEHNKDDDGEDWLPWGEAFDPNTNKWEALPDPPIHLEDSISALVVDDEDQGGTKKTVVVLASKYGKLYGYNVLTSSWDLLFMDQSFRFQNLKYREVGGPAVVLDKTLYWYSQTSREHKIEAYDLEKRMWFTGLFKGLEWDGLVTPPGDPSDHTNYSSPKLLHLEDQDLWCLVWEDHRAYKDSKKWYTCIDFIKFRVTKRINSRKGKGVLDIQIESSRIHLIYPSLCFEYAFLL